MKKSLIMLSLLLSIVMSMNVFAGEWKSDANGYWYLKGDGSYPASGWEAIDGKYYYFDANGYMLHDTVTPDGYWVGADGAWIQNATLAVEGGQTAEDIAAARVRLENAIRTSNMNVDDLIFTGNDMLTLVYDENATEFLYDLRTKYWYLSAQIAMGKGYGVRVKRMAAECGYPLNNVVIARRDKASKAIICYFADDGSVYDMDGTQLKGPDTV